MIPVGTEKALTISTMAIHARNGNRGRIGIGELAVVHRVAIGMRVAGDARCVHLGQIVGGALHIFSRRIAEKKPANIVFRRRLRNGILCAFSPD